MKNIKTSSSSQTTASKIVKKNNWISKKKKKTEIWWKRGNGRRIISMSTHIETSTVFFVCGVPIMARIAKKAAKSILPLNYKFRNINVDKPHILLCHVHALSASCSFVTNACSINLQFMIKKIVCFMFFTHAVESYIKFGFVLSVGWRLINMLKFYERSRRKNEKYHKWSRIYARCKSNSDPLICLAFFAGGDNGIHTKKKREEQAQHHLSIHLKIAFYWKNMNMNLLYMYFNENVNISRAHHRTM